MSVNLLALNAGLTAYLYVGAMVEERKLRAEYGETYSRYQAETPMLIPNPLHFLYRNR
jgi:protein-S-isoprenylcysteine O-methyltransferase Ste14